MALIEGAEPFENLLRSKKRHEVGVLLCHGFCGSPKSMRPWGDYLAALGAARIGERELLQLAGEIADRLTSRHDRAPGDRVPLPTVDRVTVLVDSLAAY